METWAAHAWGFNQTGNYTKDPRYAGVFAIDSSTRAAEITDGMSRTAMFSEIKRGEAPVFSDRDVIVVQPNLWGTGNPAINPNNLVPPAVLQ